MTRSPGLLNIGFRFLASARLALVLVGLLILLALAGAVLPQEGALDRNALAAWRQAHPLADTLLGPLGLFGVFHSPLFLAVILLLALNTLTCTIRQFQLEWGWWRLAGPQKIARGGFFLLHLALIGIMAGGFWSAAGRFDGYFLLSEGQTVAVAGTGLLRESAGPWSRRPPDGMEITLSEVRTDFAADRFLTGLAADLRINTRAGIGNEGTARINEPLAVSGWDITPDETGYSPRIQIRDSRGGRMLLDSFVALETSQEGTERIYRDFLPLPVQGQRVVMTLYPDHRRGADGYEQTGDEPDRPLLLLEFQDRLGRTYRREYLPFRQRVDAGRYAFAFPELRRWTSFLVSHDPGYPLVWLSLWLALAALLLRYWPDLSRWLGPGPFRETATVATADSSPGGSGGESLGQSGESQASETTE
jgi:cytochrome c biogenesis protein ResB